MARRLLAPLLLLLALSALRGLAAQPLSFGAAGDILEVPVVPAFGAAPAYEIAVHGGPSFIYDRWRVYGSLDAQARLGRFTLGLHVPGRTGVGRGYEEDYDEAYDLLRRLSYLRFNPTADTPLYARIGPLDDLQLGLGHLVAGFQTTTAWEERTVGLEGAVRVGRVEVGGFADDVRLNGLVGGAVTVTPFRVEREVGARPARLTLEGVYDLALDDAAPEDSAPDGTAPGGTAADGDPSDEALPLSLAATLQVPLWGEALAVGPYVTAAHQWGFGGSVGGGVEVRATRFADVLDLLLRAGVYVREEGVQIGRYDAFYPVTRGARRVIRADPYFEAPSSPRLAASLPSDSTDAGVDLLVDLAVRVGTSFTLSQSILLPTNGQLVGRYRLRIAYRAALGPQLHIALHRGGVDDLRTLFQDLDRDLTALVFHVDYPLSPRLVVRMRSRYGFQRLPLDPDVPGGPAYLVERRFEPTLGLRFRF